MAPPLPLLAGMKRIAAALIVAAGIGGRFAPARAQESLEALSFGGAPRLQPSPSLFLAPALARSTALRSVDRRALRAFATTAPWRPAVSTAPIAAFPARVSWNKSHTALAGAFVVTLLIDAGQTRQLARRGWPGFREANPLLSSRPGVGRVNSYTALAGLGVLGAAAALPPRLRPWLLGAAIAVQALTVHGSMQNGLPIRFP